MPVLFWLLVGHSLADFSFQNEFIANGKNHMKSIQGFSWWIILFNHALIHAGMVAMITQSFFLGVCELVLHFFTDLFKSNGNYGFKTDQALHTAAKVLYVVLIYYHIR